MAEIIKISTIERHLFGPDAIPWAQLVLPSNRQRLQERYRFREIREVPDAGGGLVRLTGVGGEFLFAEVPRAVEELTLEPNVIQFQINVGSDQSESFFQDVVALFAQVDLNKAFSMAAERTCSYRTIATVKLSVPFDALLSERLRTLLEKEVAPRVKLPDADAQIELERLGWRVKYRTQSTDYLYRPKRFTIEPRAGSNPAEMLYFTESPTNFKTHMELVEALEKYFESS